METLMPSLNTLDTHWEREIFLDAWWLYGKKSYDMYHEMYDGYGKDMIDALERDNLRAFVKLFEIAEYRAQKGLKL